MIEFLHTVIKNSKYYFRLFKLHFDANNWVYGLSGWPTADNNNASGALSGKSFYNVDDDSYKKYTSKIDIPLTEVKYNQEKTDFLTLFNGLEDPSLMLYVAQIGVKIYSNPGYFNNYIICKGGLLKTYECDGSKFSKFIPTEQKYAINGCLQNYLNGAYFVYVNRYRDMIAQLKADLISFNSGGLGRISASAWKTKLWTLVNASSVNYSTLEAHFDDINCLDQNYRDVYKSFSLTQRKTLLTSLLNDDDKVNKVSETFEFAIINVLTTAKDANEASTFLTLLENFKHKDDASKGGIKYVWNSFDDVGGADNLTAVVFTIGSLINMSGKSKIDEKYLGEYLSGVETTLPELETNLLEFNNVNVVFNISDNNVVEVQHYHMYNSYADLIPVRCASSFTIAGQKYPIGKLMNIPAIMLKLFSKENTMEVSNKSAWIAFDLGSCIIGVGELKLVFTAGNWVRKAVVVAGAVADVTDITLSLLDEGVLSETTINKLQIATMLLNLPNLAVNVPKVDKLITELDNKINALKLTNKAAADKVTAARKLLKDKIDKYLKVNGAGGVTRGITKIDFFNTVEDFKNPANGLLGDEAWGLWKLEKWSELEDLFKKNNINFDSRRNVYWPPNRGFIDFITESLSIDKEFDRYGGYFDNGVFIDGGNFVSPKGASFEGRALPVKIKDEPYRKYKVIKEIPGVKKGTSAPWFGQEGMGTQYELPYSIDELLKAEYIIQIN